jgi:antirestriction protein ArdC
MTKKIYELITKEIITELGKGSVPWDRPWTFGKHRNLRSKKHYRGINQFLLNHRAAQNGFTSQWWMSYKQGKALGGQVRKGEKGQRIIFWNWTEKEIENENGETEKKRYAFLRYYTVFNLNQVDNIEALPEEKRTFTPLEQAENIVDNMLNPPALIHAKQDRACYSPLRDSVTMPLREQFKSESGYYSVLFHELGHSTGHESRLNRPSVVDGSYFGTEKYSKEELLAEMTAAFLMGDCGMIQETRHNSAAYIQSWLKVLKNDNKFVVQAASTAQKAADYILGIDWCQTLKVGEYTSNPEMVPV